MAKYNGHKNWNHWNVSLWINNDENLYNIARNAVRRHNTKDEAARAVLAELKAMKITETQDGAPYTVTTIRAAIAGL
jgi:hypothetical protein